MLEKPLIGRRDIAKAISVGVAGVASGVSFWPSDGHASVLDFTGAESDMSLAERVHAYQKANSRVDDGLAIWHVRGQIFAFLPPNQIVPVFRMKNSQMKWVKRISDSQFINYPSIITYYCDWDTNEVASELTNPITGERIKPVPYVSRLKEGTELSEAGLINNVFRRAFPDDYRSSKFDVEIAVVEDTMAFHADVKLPEPLTQNQKDSSTPSGEESTLFARYAEVMDPARSWVPGSLLSQVYLPFFPWMNMGDRDGFLIFHAQGFKLRTVESLTQDYLSAVRRDHGEIFETSPEFDTGPSGWGRRLKAMGYLQDD